MIGNTHNLQLTDSGRQIQAHIEQYTPKENAFFRTMNNWSTPYFNGDGKITAGEGAINVARGTGSILTKALRSKKDIIITASVVTGTVGLAALAITAGVVSLPVLLTGAVIIGGSFALFKAGQSIYQYATAKGDEKKQARALFTTGETITATGLALAGGLAAKTATQVDDYVAGTTIIENIKSAGIIAANTADDLAAIVVNTKSMITPNSNSKKT